MPEESRSFERLSRNLHLASSKTVGLTRSLKELSVFLDGLEEKLNLIPERSEDVMLEILKMGQEGKFRDYVAAEQAVMALDLLLQANGTRGRSEAWLNELYANGREPRSLQSSCFAEGNARQRRFIISTFYIR